VTLPSVKTTYTERRSPDGEHVQAPRNPEKAEGQVNGLSGGVPVADREVVPGRRLQRPVAGGGYWGGAGVVISRER
jgi:hypothetical protein